MGEDDQLYGKVTKVIDEDTIDVETQGRTTPVRLIGVDTPETVDPEQPIGCFGPQASDYTKQILMERLIRLEIPRIGDSEDSYNEDLLELGLARTTDFSHEHRWEFERLREEAEERGAGL